MTRPRGPTHLWSSGNARPAPHPTSTAVDPGSIPSSRIATRNAGPSSANRSFHPSARGAKNVARVGGARVRAAAMTLDDGRARVVVVDHDAGPPLGPPFLEVAPLRGVVPGDERALRVFARAEPRGVPRRAPGPRGLEGRAQEHHDVPPAVELAPLEEAAVDDHDESRLGALRRQVERLVRREIDHGRPVAPVPGPAERIEQLAAQRGEVVRIFVIAVG